MVSTEAPAAFTAWCGLPPQPEAIWGRWALDPYLIAALLAVAGAYAIATKRSSSPPTRGRQFCFYLGWAVAALALVSPLCALSVSLFAARAAQHMVLAVIAAPLVAAGLPPDGSIGRLPGRSPAPAAAVFAAVIWFWQAPSAYAATFSSDGVYWAMHLTAFAAALWLWLGLLDRERRRIIPAVLASLVSSVQMGLLGALITLAPQPIYTPHSLTTAAWGLTPLQDQQLGGCILWIPGCLLFLAVTIIGLRHLLAETRFEAPSRP